MIPTKAPKKTVAIIGAGPAGCMCAYFALEKNEVTLFDFAKPLHTLLYTGGGRCNLAYAEYDFKELAKSYPRGEKFLYSVFSKFSTADTVDFFKKIGVDTYIQEDLRIFPTSDSAKEVREAMLNAIKRCKIKREKVLNIENKTNVFLLTTDCNGYKFDAIVIAIGGHNGFALAKNLGHTIVAPRPSLIGLVTSEDFKQIQGVSLKSVSADVFFENKKITQVMDDILFTHRGVSGPLIYKISSICARLDYSIKSPLKIILNLVQKDLDTFKFEFQHLLNINSKKDIKNLVCEFVPKSLAEYILSVNGIDISLKCSQVNAKTRDAIVKSLCSFTINAISPTKEGEVVTSGGISLNEINPKTMESKLVKNLYFCGEVIDVDGFCGGFNLQNCWSTGFVAGEALMH